MREPSGRAERAPADPEARLATYFAAYAEHGAKGSVAHLLRHPLASVQALSDLRGLPVRRVHLGSGLESALIAAAIPRSARGPRGAAAVLSLPRAREEFIAGSSKQTLRRKVRVAERAGTTWQRVDDPHERRLLLDLANEHERNHPLQQYRKPPPENGGLLDVALWLLARGADGRPLLLSITPVDGEESLLALFRTFEISEDASAARYLMTKVLADQLIGSGVRHLWDGVHPANLPNGLRHFQRMIGFRLVRVAQETASVRPRRSRLEHPPETATSGRST